MDNEASMHDLEDMLHDLNAKPRRLPLSLLRDITNNFSDDWEIWKGDTAVVYKGLLRNGIVAVEKLSNSTHRSEEIFNREVHCLLRVNHKNIVRLLGYCADTQGEMIEYNGRFTMADVSQWLLCYEYVPGGSLDKYITDACLGLEWRKRYKIIKGMCEGLDYLHENHIVYLDLKPANIWLNDNMVPKFCGFGFSMVFDENQNEARVDYTIPRSKGYMAPEYITPGEITFKSDIFILGVIMLEILTGQKGYNSLENILESWSDRLGTSLGDTQLEQVRVCTEICISCLNKYPAKRPGTKRIIEMLDKTECMDEFTEVDETTTMEKLVEASKRTSLVPQLKNYLQMDYEASMHNLLENLLLDQSAKPIKLPLSLLRDITNNFSDNSVIGKSGGVDVVYKGLHPKGTIAVVKKLVNYSNDNKFNQEVSCLMSTKHNNIVRLLGYCADTQGQMVDYNGKFVMAVVLQRLLCFEYIPLGSLEKYINDASHVVEWRERYRIITGICRGLHYLHGKGIVHLCLQTANILLDNDAVPKICDFGNSIFIDENRSHVNGESITGSPGYIAPELLYNGVATFKSDVYSLGVVILEILTGQKRGYSVEEILGSWRTRLGTSLADVQLAQIRVCAEVGIECIDINPDKRPDTRQVIKMLKVTGSESMDEIEKDSGDQLEGTPATRGETSSEKYPSSARSSMDNVDPLYMPHAFLQEITNDFSHQRLLGRGTFGEVYKGECSDVKEIAVKKLKFMGVEHDDFDREFKHLATLKHPNIVKLLGFCNENEEVIVQHEGKPCVAYKLHRALCFEYMHNGSLGNYLSDEDHGFGWHKRYRIIKGICEGLKYLHMGERPVFHLDLKPENILLNKNMVPKIADFGLSRLLGEENTRKTISPVGTTGYLPPEYINLQIISKEFDIFSLGVIILKIIVGPRGTSSIGGVDRDKFSEHVCNKWRQRLQLITGYSLIETDVQQVKKCIEIALKCIETDKNNRPAIGDIVAQLKLTEKHMNSLPSWMEEFDDREVMSPESNIPGLPRTLIKEIPLEFLKQVTDRFSDERKICDSMSGPVYKGILQNGELIAVKKIEGDPATPAREQFLKEATNLMVAKHENIQKLIGFCSVLEKKLVEHRGKNIIVDTDECVLCYEYGPKGSLDNYLSDKSEGIDWDTSFKVIKGICQGLHFLHHEMDAPIVHLNIWPQNIFLDDHMVPKIGDFGLSRLLGTEQTRMKTINVMGPKGYIAPEYLYSGEISTQCDIYSLGVLILEVSTRKYNYDKGNDMSSRNFIIDIRETWTDRLITSKYSTLDADGLQQVKTCIEIGFKCVDVTPSNRPSTVEIIKMINAVAKVGTGVCTELFDVYPAQIRLPFKPDKLISCSLQLTNTKHDPIAVRLLTECARRYMAKMPLCCVVPPKSTYTLIVTRSQQKKQPLSSRGEEFLNLESSIVADGDNDLKTARLDSATVKFNKFFKEAKESAADKVYELKLNVASDPIEETASGQVSSTSQVDIVENN